MAFDFSLNWNLIKQGEMIALKNLFNETSPSLLAYSNKLVQDKFLAEEVVQDVFVNIWNNREQIQIKSSVKTYLFQSVHNQAVNKLLQSKTQRNSVNVLVSEESWQYLEEHYQIDEQVIGLLESYDLEKTIKAVVESLPEQCREIFILSRYKNYSNLEIAAKLNISASAVKTQIYRALDKIRQKIF